MVTPRCFYESVATLTGCVVGAGVLGIPYAVAKAGFWTGMLVIVLLGCVMMLMHLMIGEVALRTKKSHQLVGYAEKHTGKIGKWLMAGSMVFGIYGALAAYTLGISESLAAIFGGSEWMWTVAFYSVICWLLFGGLQRMEHSEFMMESVKLFLFALIFVLITNSYRFSMANLSGFSLRNLFMPYGVILFAYGGMSAIPEVHESLKKCSLLTKRAIIIGSLIPMLIYALFAFAVIGISGTNVTEVATIGLVQFMGGKVFLLLHVFAILAMVTSFIAFGYALKQMYIEDFGLNHGRGWALTIIVPLLFIISGVQSFAKTLEVTGIFAGGVAGILVVAMHARARKNGERKPEYQIKMSFAVYALLVLLFGLGIIYGLLNAF